MRVHGRRSQERHLEQQRHGLIGFVGHFYHNCRSLIFDSACANVNIKQGKKFTQRQSTAKYMFAWLTYQKLHASSSENIWNLDLNARAVSCYPAPYSLKERKTRPAMKVIVAGMAKTGTKSMNKALNMLGFKVYDYPENTYLLTDDFIKIVNKGWTTEDFRRMYDDVDAVVDFPANFFWEEMYDAFPEAKIVLTIRDEDSWIKSLVNQIETSEGNLLFRCLEFLSPTNRKSLKFVVPLVPMAFGQAPPPFFRKKVKINREMARKIYRQHNAYVQQSAPKDKLLVYNCTEGWEPLCDFLGFPVPEEPFPHKNKGGEIVNELANHPIFRKLQREVMVSVTLILTGTIVTGIVIYKHGITGILQGVQSLAKA